MTPGAAIRTTWACGPNPQPLVVEHSSTSLLHLLYSPSGSYGWVARPSPHLCRLLYSPPGSQGSPEFFHISANICIFYQFAKVAQPSYTSLPSLLYTLHQVARVSHLLPHFRQLLYSPLGSQSSSAFFHIFRKLYIR
jgi:hypothetical protein